MRDAIGIISWNNGICSGCIGTYRDNGTEDGNYYLAFRV